MKTETTYTGELKPGDFIAISIGNWLDIGFYAGRGKTGSMQYYTYHSLLAWNLGQEETTDTPPSYPKTKSPWKSYINSYLEGRVVKLHPSVLAEKYREQYEESIEILKQLNINVEL